MITKLGVEDRNLNSIRKTQPKQNSDLSNPNFKAGGMVWTAVLTGIQECEKNPMINVAVVDLLSAILPRTFIESLTNWFAGFEAFRRESSGLIVNCLIPSLITFGAALGLNKLIMPDKAKMASCWADSTLIKRATETYSESNSSNKVKDTLKNILSNVEGFHGDKKVIYKEALSDAELEKYADDLAKLSEKNLSRKELNKEIKKITEKIVEKTHVFDNVKVGGKGQEVKASTLNTLLQDSVKYFKEYNKVSKEISITEFATKSKKLIKSKSIMGMAIILPLAASMQYINRAITEKLSGVKGAPIYDDFGKEQNEVVKQQSKEGLLKQKIISISSMLAVGIASMMKLPKWNMFEFKGWFPTMDQARIISTTTFASRMAVADDKNELAEATVRDIATFVSLYFLGDYAAKATATAIQKKTGILLLNDPNKLKEDAGVIKKFWHWMKDVSLKSSEEVVSKTAEELKGKTPTAAQKATIEKELKRAVNLRSACQAANLGVSLVLLGLVIPFFTRNNTKKKHAEQIKLAQEQSLNSGSTNTVATNKVSA